MIINENEMIKSNKIVTKSVIHGFKHNSRINVNPKDFSESFHRNIHTFVTISFEKNQLGCQGNLNDMPLFLSLTENAFKAAFRDERYFKLTKNILLKSDFFISYLFSKSTYNNLTREDFITLLKENDTVSINNGYKKGVFISKVQENFKNKNDFIDSLLLKAKLPIDYDFNNLEIETFKTIEGKPFKLEEYIDGDSL